MAHCVGCLGEALDSVPLDVAASVLNGSVQVGTQVRTLRELVGPLRDGYLYREGDAAFPLVP